MSKTCKHCKNNFDLDRSKFANHVRWCSLNPKQLSGEYTKNIKLGIQKHFDDTNGKLTEYSVICNYCNSTFTVTERSNKFPSKKYYYCTKTCLRKYLESKKDYAKIYESRSAKRVYSIKKCKQCDTTIKLSGKSVLTRVFCSKLCHSAYQRACKINPDETEILRKQKISTTRKAKTYDSVSGGGRSKRGTYAGFKSDSSWELAWIIYNIDHNIWFKRNTEKFIYTFNNETHFYYPDFILEDGTYVEIKGYMSEQAYAKILCFTGNIQVIDRTGIKKYLEYVIEKYGKDFIRLYESK